MFTEKIISKIGYIETTLPFAHYNKLLLNINSYEFSDGVDHLLAGVIETEKKIQYLFYSRRNKRNNYSRLSYI